MSDGTTHLHEVARYFADEFENYERMIVSLNETIKVMAQIDTVWTEK